MDREQAWNHFRQTGSIEAYLHYARLTQALHRPPVVQEEHYADQYRGLDPYGEKRG